MFYKKLIETGGGYIRRLFVFAEDPVEEYFRFGEMLTYRRGKMRVRAEYGTHAARGFVRAQKVGARQAELAARIGVLFKPNAFGDGFFDYLVEKRLEQLVCSRSPAGYGA